MGFASILEFAHKLVEERVLPGDIVIDATVGNGADTMFLTKLVGARGTVYGFDVQPQALEKAMECIRAEIGGSVESDRSNEYSKVDSSSVAFGAVDLSARKNGAADPTTADTTAAQNGAPAHIEVLSIGRVRLIGRSHADMESAIQTECHGQAAAVMFNLGYLPGGDHSVITKSDSTLPALESSLRLLKKGGIVTIALYSGHEGGQAEAEAVLEWACQLPQRQYQVLSYRFLNQKNHPPCLIAVEKC